MYESIYIIYYERTDFSVVTETSLRSETGGVMTIATAENALFVRIQRKMQSWYDNVATVIDNYNQSTARSKRFTCL